MVFSKDYIFFVYYTHIVTYNGIMKTTVNIPCEDLLSVEEL